MSEDKNASDPRAGRSPSATEDERYRLLIGAITDYAIYMLDVDGYITSWNPGARRFKGYEAAEIIGQHFSRFYPEEEAKAGYPQTALKIAATEGRFEGEGWRVKKDGTRFWVHVIIDPIRDPDGTLIGFAKITRDLTERRARDAERESERAAHLEALRRSEEEFRLLVQSVTDYAIYMLSPEGIVTNWNAGAERIKGYAPAEIIGSHFSRFYGAEEAAAGEPQKGLETAAREGRFEKEGWRYRKDGTRFWANVVIDPIRNPAGTLLGFTKITRDMTERKAAQEQMERARESMAQSQKMDAIGQLTGGVAHDFNNLLMAVLGSLELIRKRLPDDAKLKMLLNNAFEGARRGVSLTQRMLSFARRQELALTSVNVRDLVSGMTDLLERSLGPHISVEINIQSDLAGVKADPNQLETALLNLAVNARDAMPHGGIIKISARVEKCADVMGSKAINDDCIVVSVSDTGEGMDEATLKRAMEPFFTTKGVGKGTGLGLSMVHGMTEQLGGRVRLRSKVGQGTTVELWLPIAEGVSLGPPIVLVPEAGHGDTKVLVIVVVDDDRLVLTNTKAMLEDFGHKVIDASSGAQALELIRKTPHVDLVVTDQAMPQMTGLQLAAAIRVEWPDMPILLVSGYAELPAGDALGIPKLAKPFSLDDLERAIENFATGATKTDKFSSSYRE